MTNVVGYYSNQVGIKTGGSNGIVGLGLGDQQSKKNPAFTSGNDIFVTKKGGNSSLAINPLLNDCYNLENTLIH